MKNQIASSWKKVKLGSIANITNGKTNTQDAVSDGQYPLFDRSVSIKKSNKFLFDKTAIILPGEGAEFVPKYFSGKFDLHQRAYAIFPHSSVEPTFLYQYLNGNRNIFLDKAVGSTVKSLRLPIIRSVEVILPSLPEQRKISSILFTIDDAIEKTDQIIQKTEKLKQGLMNELLTKGIGHKKFKKTKLGEIPEEWEVLTMKDICTVRQGLQIAIKQRKNLPGDNRHVYITNKYLKDLEKPEYIEDPLKSVVCNENDILMTRTGNTGLVVTNVKGVFHNNFFLIDFDRNRLIKDFLVFYLQKPDIQKMILDRAGTTTIPDLNHGDFYSLPLVIPNKEEQKVISEIITFISKKIMSEQQAFEGLKKLKRSLMQDIFSQKVEIS